MSSQVQPFDLVVVQCIRSVFPDDAAARLAMTHYVGLGGRPPVTISAAAALMGREPSVAADATERIGEYMRARTLELSAADTAIELLASQAPLSAEQVPTLLYENSLTSELLPSEAVPFILDIVRPGHRLSFNSEGALLAVAADESNSTTLTEASRTAQTHPAWMGLAHAGVTPDDETSGIREHYRSAGYRPLGDGWWFASTDAHGETSAIARQLLELGWLLPNQSVRPEAFRDFVTRVRSTKGLADVNAPVLLRALDRLDEFLVDHVQESVRLRQGTDHIPPDSPTMRLASIVAMQPNRSMSRSQLAVAATASGMRSEDVSAALAASLILLEAPSGSVYLAGYPPVAVAQRPDVQLSVGSTDLVPHRSAIRLRLHPTFTSVFHLVDLYRRGRIEVQPTSPRTVDAVVDRLLAGLPVGPIIAAETDDTWTPIEGDDIVAAVIGFLVPPASGVEHRLSRAFFWPNAAGRTFSELAESDQRQLETTQIVIHVGPASAVRQFQ